MNMGELQYKIVMHFDVSTIPKVNLFRFENYWLDQAGFMDCVREVWELPSAKIHITTVIMDKLKRLRGVLKAWQKNISKIKSLISKCNRVIFVLDCLEEFRQLTR